MPKKNKNFSVFNLVFGVLSLFIPIILFHLGSTFQNLMGIEWRFVRLAAWIVCFSSLVAVLLIIGFRLKGRVFGVLINERNRYSLSRFQMLLWTVTILTSLYIILLNNIYKPSDANNSFSLDWQLIALLGMSVGNVVATPMILNRKSNDVSGVSAQSLLNKSNSNIGLLNTKTDENEAILSDLVLGEEVGNQDCIDIGRIQMLMMTLMAVTVYGWMIGDALISQTLYIKQMPPLNETLLGLILVSHGGYLTGKLKPTADTQGQTANELSRALLLSQKSKDLVHRLELETKDPLTITAKKDHLNYLYSIAQPLSVEVADLCSQFGKNIFDSGLISRLEGKYEAISNSANVASSNVGVVSNVANAPNSNTVRKVQTILASKGLPLQISGTVDASTYSAIDKYLADLKISREDLSPEPYRMFEEIVAILT